MSPKSELFKAVLERIKLKAPEVRYIAQDVGQLEDYEVRPPVSWPCALLDIDELKYSDLGNHTTQMGEGFINIRLGLVQYTKSSNLTPDAWMAKALDYYEVEQKVFKALHGWAPTGWGKLLRRASATEKREDSIRVVVMRFAISYKDVTPKPTTIKVSRPGLDANYQIK